MRARAPGEACDCSGIDVGLGAVSSNNIDGGTIVGTLVSMKMRSGGGWRDVIRMTGLLIVSL
jgi:hypothetical protein